jgi:hypothetical protein
LKKTYTIVSQEGADHFGQEIGSEVAADLVAREHHALVAAGWVEEKEDDKEGDKK